MSISTWNAAFTTLSVAMSMSMSVQWNMIPEIDERPFVSAHEKWFFSADGAVPVKQHVAREEARRRVLLAEGGDLLQCAHRFERELVELMHVSISMSGWKSSSGSLSR